MMNKNENKNAKNGFNAAREIAADNEVYTFIDFWGIRQSVVGYEAYREAVAAAREAWRDSVGC